MQKKQVYYDNVKILKQDFYQIKNYFSGSKQEKILPLIVKGNFIFGRFKMNQRDTFVSQKGFISYSAVMVRNQIDYCAKNDFGYYLIHNHPIGNQLSETDMETNRFIINYASKFNLSNLTFGIWNIRDEKLMNYYYVGNSNNYVSEEIFYS